MRERFRLKSGKVYDQIADKYLSLRKCIKTLNEYDDTLESLSFVVQENVMLRKKLDQLQENDYEDCYVNGGKMEYDFEPFESLDVLKIEHDSDNNMVEVSTVFSLSLNGYFKNNKCLLTVPLLTDKKPFISNDNIYHEIDFKVFQQLNDKITYSYDAEMFDWILSKMQSLINNGCVLCYCIKLIEI